MTRSAAGLPVHFFTIVVNGEPFIRYHIGAFKVLPFRWHWHVVEGVADLVHDTAWSLETGGRIAAEFHDRGRSNDGTTAYLDRIAKAFPEQVTLYRKPAGTFWDGKREMVSAPLPNIAEDCLLWQVDADELWRPGQIIRVRERFVAEPRLSAAYFWCNYFVGPDALISTRNNYAQNPNVEWLRVWRYQPGDRWRAHEPPRLARRRRFWFGSVDVAKIAPLMHAETEALGAVFQHPAYVNEEQVRFKEAYYGYKDALRGWRSLQDAVRAGGPVLLRDYLPWVNDDTHVDSASRLGIELIATRDPTTQAWRFSADEDAPVGA